MEITPQIFTAKVMHKRLFPKINAFTYGVYYLALPLSNIRGVARNKFSILSFYDKDHGAKDGSDLNKWIQNILKTHDLSDVVDAVMLVSMPRLFGYVFNPVSFWLCIDNKCNLQAVLCQVNNTFGETHSYLCAHKQGGIISNNEWLQANKLFHVSPFLKREGHYRFRFDLKEATLGIWIDFYDAKGRKQLITSLIGHLAPLTKANLRKAFWTHPLVTFKTIFLIHWQALKLMAKGIKYIPKPKQLKEEINKISS